MASNEKQFKAEFVKAAREQGGHAVVISGSYLAGIPDLYIKMPELPGFWLELKYVETQDSNPVRLTPLQRSFIRKENEAGGMAVWLLCANRGGGSWDLYGGRDARIEHASPRHLLDTRKRGGTWYPLQNLRRLTERYG